jgi:hypothetical protein
MSGAGDGVHEGGSRRGRGHPCATRFCDFARASHARRPGSANQVVSRGGGGIWGSTDQSVSATSAYSMACSSVIARPSANADINTASLSAERVYSKCSSWHAWYQLDLR